MKGSRCMYQYYFNAYLQKNIDTSGTTVFVFSKMSAFVVCYSCFLLELK
jgi:hypothetical protein